MAQKDWVNLRYRCAYYTNVEIVSSLESLVHGDSSEKARMLTAERGKHREKASKQNGKIPPPLTHFSRRFCGHECFGASTKSVACC